MHCCLEAVCVEKVFIRQCVSNAVLERRIVKRNDSAVVNSGFGGRED